MASTSGWIRFSSRWKRVPTTFVTRLLSIRLLTIQPVGGDVAAHRVGHEIAYRASQSRPLPHERRRHVDRRYFDDPADRSEEHTSELQSRLHLVCRLLLEKKKTICERKY